MRQSEALESNQALLVISEPCRHGHRPPTEELRRQGSNLRLAINSRASCRSTTPERESGRRGSRTPKARGPPVFETGYRAGGSPSRSGPGRSRTCTPPIKSRQLCQLSYGAEDDVAGRNRTCGAPRFRRPLYRAELRPREDGRGWTRTSSLLFVRQALSAIELLARRWSSGTRTSNLDLHVQSVVSCRLDDPGSQGHGRALRPPRTARSTQRHGRSRACSSYGTSARSRTMLFMPLANPSTLDRRDAASYVEELWSPALLRFRKIAGKSRGLFSSEFCCAESAEEPFSLRRGLEFSLALSSWASPFGCVDFGLRTRRRRPSRSPSLQLLCG